MYIYFQKFSAKHRAISTTGGWCANTSKEDGGEHMTDQRLIPALADLFTGKVVQIKCPKSSRIACLFIVCL